MKLLNRRTAFLSLIAAGAAGAWWYARPRPGAERAKELFASPLPKPDNSLNVYHLGHSLVGRDMPAMLAQLAGAGHRYNSQLGWGTSLKQHWEPTEEINGFDHENAHSLFRPAREAIGSGDYDAVVLTEMVEIKDSIRYHDSAAYLARWAGLAWEANPNSRIYLYETWHHTDDGNGWLYRIDRDLEKYWQSQVQYPALAKTRAPIHLIPAGQVKAGFIRAVQAKGGVEGIENLHGIFAGEPGQKPDTIHFNDLGAYLVALTHYAVLYHKSPVGLPHRLLKADGSPAVPPSDEAALLMQEITWEVVQRHPETGVAAV